MNRRLIRETVLQALYALKQSNESVKFVSDTVLKDVLAEKKEERRFAEKLFFTAAENNAKYDSIIEKHIKNWEIHRLALIDLLILKIALTEFLYFDDIPSKVTINEAIELGKKFSTAKSGKFINGILDAAYDELDAAGEIKKSGRGLISESLKSTKE